MNTIDSNSTKNDILEAVRNNCLLDTIVEAIIEHLIDVGLQILHLTDDPVKRKQLADAISSGRWNVSPDFFASSTATLRFRIRT